MAQLLEGIRVLDLGRNVAAPFAAKLFADYGADVVKVEAPRGDPARRAGPFLGDEPHPERSALFLHVNTSKRGITLDLATVEGQRLLRGLAAEADVVVEDFAPGQLAEWGLDYDSLSADRDDLVLCSITPFGQTGPYRDYRASEITLQAMGGPLHLNGSRDRYPVKLAGNVAHYHAGVSAAYAIMLARLRVEGGGRGDWIDLAVYETQAGFRDRRTVYMTGAAYTGYSAQRRTPGARTATGVRPCADGFVNVLGGAKHFAALLREIGRPDLINHEDFDRPVVSQSPEFVQEVEASYLVWLMQHSKREVISIAQGFGILSGALNTTEDLVTDPHYRGRGVWESVEHPEAGTFEYPGRQLILSETPKQPLGPAPLLGQHNEEVLVAEYGAALGLSTHDLPRLREAGVIA
jgi:crotonobetainyl-CoA:carnitine CoA-transferase CaiB-like acyl-CoA transferase